VALDQFRPAWLTDEVAMFQENVRRFLLREFVPHVDAWREQGCVDRALWRKAGEAGLLAASLPEKFGGGGRYALMATVLLEQARVGDAAWGIGVQNYVSHYILAYGTPEQQDQWLPRLASGNMVAAIAMTEPGAGSDLKNIATVARREEDSASTHEYLGGWVGDRINMRTCKYPGLGTFPNLTYTATAEAARQAYGMFHLGPADIDITLLSVNFAHLGPIIMEDLGFAQKGRGVDLYREGGRRGPADGHERRLAVFRAARGLMQHGQLR
jgi:hypothetical protein